MTGTESLDTGTPLAGLDLPVLRLRVTLRMAVDAVLPASKANMLRGGFGYAFQRSTCPQACWGLERGCAAQTLCPFRWVFDTPHPPGVPHLHDLQDVPRPFVIEPPLDGRTSYGAGDALEFGLVLLGRGIDYLSYFLFGFEQLGRMGLGPRRAPAMLDRVEALRPWQLSGPTIYQDGRALDGLGALPVIDTAQIAARAATLPASLRLRLITPLRVKARGELLRTVDLPAIVQAACWRLNALATFHGGGPWPVDHRALVEQARAVRVAEMQVRWEDWERTSTRGAQPQKMTLGGLVGEATLHDIPAPLRTILLAGSLVHVGKACVFGHGRVEVVPVAPRGPRSMNVARIDSVPVDAQPQEHSGDTATGPD